VIPTCATCGAEAFRQMCASCLVTSIGNRLDLPADSARAIAAYLAPDLLPEHLPITRAEFYALLNLK